MEGPTIRDADKRDIEPVLQLWREAGSVPTVSDTPEALALLLDDSPGVMLVAESSDEVVGSLIVGWDGWRGSLYRLAVRPGHRRRGIAVALVEEGERRLRMCGASRLNVIVVRDAAAATGFWDAVGYEHEPSQARFTRNVSPS